MSQTKKPPTTLLEAVRYFSDPETLLSEVVSLRWPGGITCPFCGSDKHTPIKNRPNWYCKGCKKQFSAKVGTIFEDSALGFDKWMIAIWLISNAKNGISSHELHRAIGITQKSAWHMLHRIREAMTTGIFKKMGGTVEADETFVGGKAKNRASKRGKGGANYRAKAPVLGVIERGGEMFAVPVPDVKRGSLRPILDSVISPEATIYTDALHSYDRLKWDFNRHRTIDHKIAFVDGDIHTNNAECFWSLLKRSINGTYVHVSPKHLGSYVQEQAYRYNARKGDDQGRFEWVVGQVSGKRLTYEALKGR